MHEIGIEWMTQTEVNGHFLELRGIPDEKLEWDGIWKKKWRKSVNGWHF